jgi:hypothetical protein
LAVSPVLFRVVFGSLDNGFRPTAAKNRSVNLPEDTLEQQARTELEAAAFRRLVQHLRDRPEVQNIDLMNLAGFCRNCLSKWYRAAAEEKGLEMTYEEAREIIYGLPYSEWKAKYQREATPQQQAAFEEAVKQTEESG